MSMVGPTSAPVPAEGQAEGPTSSVPMVAGIIVVGDDERINLARSAVTSFLRQTYPNKEVVIVNAAPNKSVLEKQWPTLREFRVNPVDFPTIGALRNKAIEESNAEWILPFDDDDHSHLHRMFMQMAVRREGKCVLANKQLRVDIERSTLCLYENKDGLSNTVLFPKHAANGELNLYDADMVEYGEDDEFVNRCFGSANSVVLDTGPEWFPGPCLTVGYYHTRNKSSRERFFGEYAGSQYEGKIIGNIPEDHRSYLQDVMARQGLDAKIVGSGPVGAATQ